MSGVSGLNPAFSIFFFFFFFFFVYFLITFRFYISFHLFIIINNFSLCFLVMIFHLLVSGVRAGRLYWVGQQPAVLAAVW